ncbi:hypothetical protein AB0I77_22435 [Streptomyces sp. NPDC050619]|uniref:hypothetical protein n=1 Tax=Streptomyces sp. NPDC050619 TaxID=3157214 RepID=UPI00343CDB0E
MTALLVGSLALLAWAAVEAAAWLLIRWHRPFFPWLITPRDAAPDIPADVVAAHAARSFDAELGWCRRPGEQANETTEQGTVGFRIDERGRRANPGFEELPPAVACFGDSFTFCRLVDDDRTWPHHLSRETGRVTANYGVGNYGLDQALLRLERELPALEADTVLMGVVPETIARVHSAWKHYFEYGNTLAFKPRFTLAADGALVHHPPAVTRPEDYAHYRMHLDRIQRLDPFYRRKFRQDLLRLPYMPRLVRRTRRHLPILWYLSVHRLLGRPEAAFRRAFQVVLHANSRVGNALYREEEATRLLRVLVERFAHVCRDTGKRPVLVVLPQPTDLPATRSSRARDRFFASLAGTLPVVDLTADFRAHPAPSLLYVHGRLGPHASDEGNRLIARVVGAHLEQLAPAPHATKEFQ